VDTEQRALRAAQLRDDVVFREVVDGLKAAAIAAWTQTKTDDTRQREFSWLMVKALDAIERQLQSMIDDQHLSMARSVHAPN